MPIKASAKKALRTSLNKTAVNRRRKGLLKEATKSVSTENLAKAVSMIDKAAKWGIMHPNKAARLKSRLSKQFTATPAVKAAPKAATSAPKKSTPKATKKA